MIGIWRLSNERMTVRVVTRGKIIIDAAPIVRKFIGQPFNNLAHWMNRMSPVDVMLMEKRCENNCDTTSP
jgi:hypothetical protein